MPIQANESAAVKTLKTAGSSIEDYGKRNQPIKNQNFGKKIKVVAEKGIKREIVKQDDPNCPNCTNASLISQKKDA